MNSFLALNNSQFWSKFFESLDSVSTESLDPNNLKLVLIRVELFGEVRAGVNNNIGSVWAKDILKSMSELSRFNVIIDRSIYNIHRSIDIGFDTFKWIVFGRWYDFCRSSMDDIINTR